MKSILLLGLTTVVVSSAPRPVHSDISAYPLRQFTKRGQGKNLDKYGSRRYGMQKTLYGTMRPDSPPKEGHVKVSAKGFGTGSASVRREKYVDDEFNVDKQPLGDGDRATRETHDAKWAEAETKSTGRPPPGAAKQSHLLHPMKVEGSGRNVYTTATAPNGGYAHIQKAVDGKVVRTQRIPAGKSGSDEHSGSKPNEAKITASTSRGGETFLHANNNLDGSVDRVNNFDSY